MDLDKLDAMIEQSKVDKNAVARNTAVQENKLLRCRRDYMTAIETKLYYMGLSKVIPRLPARKGGKYEEPKNYSGKIGFTFSPEEVRSITGNKTQEEILDICKQLKRRIIQVEYENGEWDLICLFEKIKWRNKEGLTLIFDDDLKPFILELQKGNYTRIAVENIYSLQSTYAIRLLELGYELTKIPEIKKRKRNIDIKLLRYYLDIPDNKYQRIDLFKMRVINEPLKEVNNLDLPFKISCTPYKDKEDKRKVAGFTLKLIYPKEPKKKEPELQQPLFTEQPPEEPQQNDGMGDLRAWFTLPEGALKENQKKKLEKKYTTEQWEQVEKELTK